MGSEVRCTPPLDTLMCVQTHRNPTRERHRASRPLLSGGASTQDCGWRDAVDIGLPMYNFFWQRERPPSWTEMLRTRTLVDVHFGGSIWGHSGRGACSLPLPSKWTPYQEQRLGPLQSGESIQFASCNPGVRTWLAEYLTQVRTHHLTTSPQRHVTIAQCM